MIIQKLIEKLKQFPEETNIFIEDDKGKFRWIMLVEENHTTAELIVILKLL